MVFSFLVSDVGCMVNWEYKKRNRMANRDKFHLEMLRHACHMFWESQAGE